MALYAGSQPQKGITTYALAGNRQRPLAGVMNAAIFNNWRRFRAQVLYFAPPLIIAYMTMNWAVEKYVDLKGPVLREFRLADIPVCQERILQLEERDPGDGSVGGIRT